MNLQKAIDEKIEFIKNKTGDDVKIETEMPEKYKRYGAIVDFESWDEDGCSGLPTICIDENFGKVQLLHELIHLEKFFVEKYPIIVSRKNFHDVINVFKNIPEDYVAHKIINDVYNLNPISPVFLSRDNVSNNRSDKQLAADLTNYYFFSEFNKEYRKRLAPFMTNCLRQRRPAYLIAQKVIKCISKIDYKDKSSYEKSAKKLIKIFEPNNSQILLNFFEKNGSVWNYSSV